MPREESTALTLVDENGEVMEPGRAIERLASPDNLDQMKQLVKARDRAIHALLEGREDTTYVTSNDVRKPTKEGYQLLGRTFYLEVETVEKETWWEPPVEGEPEQRPHFVAEVKARGRTPWGTSVTKVRRCTSREDRFYFSGSGQYNDRQYRDAENICLGTAETRAHNACIDHLLAIGRAEGGDGVDEEGREARKSRRRQRFDRLQEWNDLLGDLGVEGHEEDAFYRTAKGLPNELEAFTLDDFDVARRLVEKHATEDNPAAAFDKAWRVADEARQKRDESKREPEESRGEAFRRDLEKNPLPDGAAGEAPPPQPDAFEAPNEDSEPEPGPLERKLDLVSKLTTRTEALGVENPSGWLLDQAEFLVDVEGRALRELELEELEVLADELEEMFEEKGV